MTAGDKSFQTICFHSLTGVGYKRAKSAHFATLVDYLHNRKGKPTVLCCDLNEPEVDHFQLDKNVYFSQYRGDKGDDPARILNPEGIHDLEDAFRIWLRQKGALSSEIKHRQESAEDIKNSPLAVSHKVGRIHSKGMTLSWSRPTLSYTQCSMIEGGVEMGVTTLLIGKFS